MAATISVYLFQNNDSIDKMTTQELEFDGEPLIRFCRIPTSVEQPFALVTVTTTENEKLNLSEFIYRLDQNGDWVSQDIGTERFLMQSKQNQEN